jgi:excisionase family DNA binding protein
MTELLTAKEMQNLLQVDRSTIYRMAEGQRLPALKVGKQWRFPSDQVAQWLAGQTTLEMPRSEPVRTEANPVGLADLLPLDCVQLMQDTFAETLGVMLVITDLIGQPITAISNPCGLFEVINQQPGAIQKCVQSWQKMGATLELEPRLTPSHLGLLCARGLVRVGPELKGMVVAGGIAPQAWPPDPAAVQAMATEFRVKPEQLNQHLTEVFFLEEAEQARLLITVQRIANIIAHIINERRQMMGKVEAGPQRRKKQ